MLNEFQKYVVLYGGTGQAKVLRPIIEHYGAEVVGVIDDTRGLKSPFENIPIFCGLKPFNIWLSKNDRKQISYIVSIGNPYGKKRIEIGNNLENLGLKPVSISHPSAVIETNAVIGSRCQILAGAIIGAEAKLGDSVIVNTNASVDHEDTLDDGSEVAPGARLCGSVRLHKYVWVCAGATILPRITIGESAIVGAGAVVNRDVLPGKTVVGVPARELQK